MNNNTEIPSLESKVMEAIHAGKVHMRPRWHFLLFSAFGIVGALIVFLTVLYVASLAVFFLRESGAWFAPSFGPRGWLLFLRSLPWLLLVLIVAFVLLLQLLVRRYQFVYRKPLLFSILGILALIALGGFALAQTQLHRQLFISARHGDLPQLFWYQGHMRPPHGDLYHGTITAITKDGLVLSDIDEGSTSTIIVTAQTRLPYGADFSVGDFVVVVGDETATDTVRAYGIREVEE